MIVFEVIGLTSQVDWASIGEPKSLGLFSTADKAEAFISSLKEQKDWRMDWNRFDIKEREVK